MKGELIIFLVVVVWLTTLYLGMVAAYHMGQESKEMFMTMELCNERRGL